jgi:hypothetical protein
MDAVQRIAAQHKDVDSARTWLLGRALEYYELTQTWDAAEQKYIKTPAKFFKDRVYEEDPSLWDRSAPLGGTSGRNTGTKRNSSRGQTERNLDDLQRAFPVETPATPTPDRPSDNPPDADPRQRAEPVTLPARFAGTRQVPGGPFGHGLRASGGVSGVVGIPRKRR